MKHPNTLKGRRQLAAAAVFVITTLGLATGILAEDRTTEQANIEVVNAFIAAWSEPDEAVTFLAADASVRMIEGQPAVAPAGSHVASKMIGTPYGIDLAQLQHVERQCDLRRPI